MPFSRPQAAGSSRPPNPESLYGLEGRAHQRRTRRAPCDSEQRHLELRPGGANAQTRCRGLGKRVRESPGIWGRGRQEA